MLVNWLAFVQSKHVFIAFTDNEGEEKNELSWRKWNTKQIWTGKGKKQYAQLIGMNKMKMTFSNGDLFIEKIFRLSYSAMSSKQGQEMCEKNISSVNPDFRSYPLHVVYASSRLMRTVVNGPCTKKLLPCTICKLSFLLKNEFNFFILGKRGEDFFYAFPSHSSKSFFFSLGKQANTFEKSLCLWRRQPTLVIK